MVMETTRLVAMQTSKFAVVTPAEASESPEEFIFDVSSKTSDNISFSATDWKVTLLQLSLYLRNGVLLPVDHRD